MWELYLPSVRRFFFKPVEPVYFGASGKSIKHAVLRKRFSWLAQNHVVSEAF